MRLRDTVQRRNSNEGFRERRRDERHQALYTHAWSDAATRYRIDNPLCVYCAFEGLAVPATDTDHIRPHCGNETLFWDATNWQALCAECHSRKSWREARGMVCDWKINSPHVIVSGKPSTGKSTLVNRLLDEHTNVWDMDTIAAERGWPRYPRPQWQLDRLLKERGDMVAQMATPTAKRTVMIIGHEQTGYDVAKKLTCRWHVCWRQYDRSMAVGGGIVT